MAVGTGGQGGNPPNILPTQKYEFKRKRHINQCIAIRLKWAHSSVNFGNHRYTNLRIVSFLYESVI